MFRFGIIGCGRIAAKHADYISNYGQLIAVCDIIPEKATELANRFGAKEYNSLEAMLESENTIDVIAVCTPNGLHAEHSIKSLQAGKHVLCEKPMCLTSAAAWQMRETEKYTRKKLFIVKSGRHNPNIKILRTLIETGQLGEIYSFQLNCVWNRENNYYSDWHGKIFPDGGTLYTQFSHYLDIILWLFGDAEELNSFSGNFAHTGVIEFEDTGVANLKMKSGAIGNLHWTVNSYRRNAEISLLVVAEKATVSMGGPYLNSVNYFLSDLENPFQNIQSNPNVYQHYLGSMSHHNEIYQQLISDLENNKNSNSMDGVKTVELIEKIYKSISIKPAS